MATIVLHQKSGKRLILLGTGYGAFKSSRPSFFGGNLFPNEEEGQMALASVCDRNGRIEWVYSDELVVVEIDGEKVENISGISDLTE